MNKKSSRKRLLRESMRVGGHLKKRRADGGGIKQRWGNKKCKMPTGKPVLKNLQSDEGMVIKTLKKKGSLH